MLSAWTLMPEELRALGYQRDATHLFGRLQRVGSWVDGRPQLSRHGRETLEGRVDFTLPSLVEVAASSDGSRRVVLELGDGERIEAVHMPRALRRARVTVCLSTQVGCAMGCAFCATARMKLRRNLAAHEIVGQLLAVLRAFGPSDSTTLNVVFMGMGEPLHNVDAVVRALDVICDEAGLGVAPTRVTVSTVGLVPGIERLGRARHLPRLALSVNEITDEARARIMPVAQRHSLAALREALLRYPRRPHEKITLEYVVLGGENHESAHAARLATFSRGMRHVLNLIPFNPWPGSSFREPTEHELQVFARALSDAGCLVTIRRSRGRDSRGACGTLVSAGALTRQASMTRSEPRTTP